MLTEVKIYGKGQGARKVLIKREGSSCSKPKVRSLAYKLQNVGMSSHIRLENKDKE